MNDKNPNINNISQSIDKTEDDKDLINYPIE